jgi:hypothetical protein
MVEGQTFICKVDGSESGMKDSLTPRSPKELTVVKPINDSHKTPMKEAEKILTQAGPPSSPPIPLLRKSRSTKPSSVMKAKRRAAKLISAVDTSPIGRLLFV